MNTRRLELLAPSGDWDSFLSAINNGADAIYLGLGEFNARAKSTYFTMDNIADTVRYAHLRGVKIYVTINTLVSDDEMPNFIKLVEACIRAKVDAYIVQDYGCARVLKNMFPEIELHASTQMGIHNLLGAKLAKEVGFSRVVLSRETKLSDIVEIASLGIEIEYFVQGALCVAFSGNCYFSALNHGMSGNRGKCLQLCRLPYTATQNGEEIGNGYLLSARDLCMLDSLSELVNAGVMSFKIEGRLRRAGYVAQAVNTYRKALDAVSVGNKINTTTEIAKLRQVFSRGDFNYRAYLDAGVPDDVINPVNQNHLGLKIGKIVSVERFKDLFKVGIKATHSLISGDGLKFCDEFGVEIGSLGVGNVEKRNGIEYIFTKHKLSEKLDVYLTLDNNLESSVLSNIRKVSTNVEFFAEVDKPIRAVAITTHPTTAKVEIVSDYICQMAKTAPTNTHEIAEIFGNLDLEIFDAKLTNINIGNVFIPKSALKDVRRRLAEKLKSEILTNYESRLPQITQVNSLQNLTPQIKIQPKFGNIIIANENSSFEKIYIAPNDLIMLMPLDYSMHNIQELMQKLKNIFSNIGLALPTIANAQDCVKLQNIVNSLPQSTPLLVQNAYGIELGKGHYLIAGPDMNVYNHYTISALQDLGIDEFVWSKEISCNDPSIYQYAYGRPELMHFAHCPYKTLWHNTCQECHYSPDLILHDQSGKSYRILRHKISQCYFTLFAENLVNKEKITKKYIDLR